MNIVVFGLGHSGAMATPCLLRDGQTIAGIDVSPTKALNIAIGMLMIADCEAFRNTHFNPAGG